MADEIPDCSDVMLDFLGKRQSCTHQPGDALTERIVKPLDVIGFTRLLRDGFVLLGWDHAFVNFVLIRIEGGLLTVLTFPLVIRSGYPSG